MKMFSKAVMKKEVLQMWRQSPERDLSILGLIGIGNKSEKF